MVVLNGSLIRVGSAVVLNDDFEGTLGWNKEDFEHDKETKRPS